MGYTGRWPMNIDLMMLRTNMNAVVNNIEPSTKDMTRRYTGSSILASISFSDMLENALRNELISYFILRNNIKLTISSSLWVIVIILSNLFNNRLDISQSVLPY